MEVSITVSVTMSVTFTMDMSGAFSVDYGLLNNFSNNGSSMGFLDDCLFMDLMDDGILVFSVGSVNVLFMYNW